MSVSGDENYPAGYPAGCQFIGHTICSFAMPGILHAHVATAVIDRSRRQCFDLIHDFETEWALLVSVPWCLAGTKLVQWGLGIALLRAGGKFQHWSWIKESNQISIRHEYVADSIYAFISTMVCSMACSIMCGMMCSMACSMVCRYRVHQRRFRSLHAVISSAMLLLAITSHQTPQKFAGKAHTFACVDWQLRLFCFT